MEWTRSEKIAITGVALAIIIPLSIAYYTEIYYPNYIKPNPNVVLIHSPHWTSTERDVALHDYIFVNEGDAPAKELGLHFELDPKFRIISVESDREWDKKTGGEGHYSVELLWDELPPQNSFHVLIYTETSPAIEDLYPAMYKAWYREKIIDKYGK